MVPAYAGEGVCGATAVFSSGVSWLQPDRTRIRPINSRENTALSLDHPRRWDARYVIPFFIIIPYQIKDCLKKRILVQGQGGDAFQTAGRLKYVEDLNRSTNAEIGPEGALQAFIHFAAP
jgi:hypothetical protein